MTKEATSFQRLLSMVEQAHPPVRNQQHSPLPEAIDGGEWKVSESETPRKAFAKLNQGNPGGELVVPQGEGRRERLVRAHELGHVAISPRRVIKTELPQPLIQLCEDARVGAQLQRLGFEFDTQLLDNDDYDKAVYSQVANILAMLVATKNTADEPHLKRYLRQAHGGDANMLFEWADTVHEHWFTRQEQLDDFDLSTMMAAAEIDDRAQWMEQHPGEQFPGDGPEGEGGEPTKGGGKASGKPGEGEGEGEEGDGSEGGSEGAAAKAAPKPGAAPSKKPSFYKPSGGSASYKPLPTSYKPWSAPPTRPTQAFNIQMGGLPNISGSSSDSSEPRYGGHHRLSDLTTDRALQRVIETGDKGGRSAEMHVTEAPRSRRLTNKMMGRKVRVSEDGLLRNPSRLASCDPRVFARTRKRKGGGTLLIDTSGSMSLSIGEMEAIIKALPAALVAIYSGRGATGELRIVARNGKMCSKRDLKPYGGANVVDVPALQWLCKQKAPRVWISDGWVTGIERPGVGGDHIYSDVGIEAAKAVKAGRIVRVDDVSDFLHSLDIEPVEEEYRDDEEDDDEDY